MVCVDVRIGHQKLLGVSLPAACCVTPERRRSLYTLKFATRCSCAGEEKGGTVYRFQTSPHLSDKQSKKIDTSAAAGQAIAAKPGASCGTDNRVAEDQRAGTSGASQLCSLEGNATKSRSAFSLFASLSL
jgi:hypothetical protein